MRSARFRRKRRVAAGALAVGVLGIGLVSGPSQAADARAGLRLAERLCAGCHALTAGGPSPHADAPPFPVVAKRYPPSDLAEALAEGIAVRSHRIAMPEFAFEPTEVDDLIAFLETLR